MNAIFSFPNLIGMPLRWFVGNPKHSNEAGVGNFQTWQGGWLSAYRSWFTSGSTPCWHNHCSTLPQRDNKFVVWYCCVCLVLWICVAGRVWPMSMCAWKSGINNWYRTVDTISIINDDCWVYEASNYASKHADQRWIDVIQVQVFCTNLFLYCTLVVPLLVH